jgi:predicted nucleic acid-binding protein
MAATEVVAVLDAGPLIHLDELGRLDILNDFAVLLVPKLVLEEAVRHRPGMRLDSLVGLEVVVEPPRLTAELQKLADDLALHAGECAALGVLKARHGRFLLSDDAAARAVAQAAGFQTHGTIGLILRLKRRGLASKSDVLRMLRQMPLATSLHIHASLLASVVASVEAETE